MSLVYHQKLSRGRVACLVTHFDSGKAEWLDLSHDEFRETWHQDP